ncbi:anti-sigma factor [Microlunatus speluncae]|uniref:anti-sigma factor n=1 Tax=Microlunatus speluncae TaxID=2594267 RepID=UPI001375CF40|nr:anti-sigma factor [Microlunatus speluncae]
MNDIHGYVGAYVAHALDDELRLVFAEHLEDCESCRQEVREFREALAELSLLEAAQPPDSVRSGVMAGISRTRIEPPEDPERPDAPSDSVRSGVLAAIADDRPTEVVREPSTTDRHRLSRTSRWLTLAVAASLLIAVVLGGWAVLQQRRISDLERAQQAESDLLHAPDLRSYPIDLYGTPGTFLVSRAQDRALFMAEVPPPPAGRDYQLWIMRDAGVVPGPVFDSGHVREWLNGVDGASGFAVSVEADGGSRTGAPSSTPTPRSTTI